MQLRRRPRRLPAKKLAIALVVVLVLAGSTGIWLLTRPAPAAAQTATMTVSEGDFSDTVSATGTLAPAKQADLNFPVEGRVTEVNVKPGAVVKQGQVLARIDTVALKAALSSAEAQLDAAESTADNDGDETSTQRAANDAQVDVAEAGVREAEQDLDAASLTATFGGTVAAVDIAVGDQVSGDAPQAQQGEAATAQVVVITPKQFLVDATISADDVTLVKKGMQAAVTPSGATEPVYGTVSEVGLVATASDSGAATFPVTIAITGPQTGLYAGTSAEATITVKQITDVLTVPSLALHTSGETTYVNKLVSGKVVKTTVTLGATYGIQTEVKSGLKAGDQVEISTVRPGTGTRTGNGTGGFQGPGGGEFPGGGPPVIIQQGSGDSGGPKLEVGQ